jgi:two-component system OmpR family sensor kinase
MDGLQGRLTNSLQFRLAAALSALIITLALGAGAFSFWTAFEEANELQDDQLRQMAALIDRHEVPVAQLQPGASEQGADPDLEFVVQVIGGSAGNAVAGGGLFLSLLPPTLADGLQTAVVGKESWRLFVRPLHTGAKLVVGQQIAARDEIARHGALRTVLPLLALVPVLLLLVGVVVRQTLKPILALSGELDRRNENDLAALREDGVPNEIRPFTASINRLLGRVTRSMDVQRRFVADAAHELRTPLTVLSLQAEALASKELPDNARDRLVSLRRGIQRARSLLEQLLTLARFEAATVATTHPTPVSAMAAVRTIIEEQLPLAEAKHIDLGVVGDGEDALVHVRDVELHSLLRNLIDNALRYTPPGGRVDVGLKADADGVTVEVADSGPGIPAGERERVFDPFYRVLGTDADGSGLGLSIVKTLAERMGITVKLDDARSGAGLGGLRVRVSFPPALAGASRASPLGTLVCFGPRQLQLGCGDECIVGRLRR